MAFDRHAGPRRDERPPGTRPTRAMRLPDCEVSMAVSKIRADYDQLQAAASRFDQQAQTTRQTLRNLQHHMEVLQGADWAGQGAQAFYAEMDSQVVPTMNRLIGALEQAADTTRQIRRVVQ